MIRIFICLCISLFSLSFASSDILTVRSQWKTISDNKNVIVIASPVRTGSTMLFLTIKKQNPLTTYKTHLLPPNRNFKGKILFIFSNPDFSAESALFRSIREDQFGIDAFRFLEITDRQWLKNIGSTTQQTLTHNLLAYDALRVSRTLSIWLHETTTPCRIERAQILAVKYEDLWEDETCNAIRTFLDWEEFTLPDKKKRGAKIESLLSQEQLFRSTYNLGSREQPRYAAYDEARTIWEAAPSFQFLKIIRNYQDKNATND